MKIREQDSESSGFRCLFPGKIKVNVIFDGMSVGSVDDHGHAQSYASDAITLFDRMGGLVDGFEHVPVIGFCKYPQAGLQVVKELGASARTQSDPRPEYIQTLIAGRERCGQIDSGRQYLALFPEQDVETQAGIERNAAVALPPFHAGCQRDVEQPEPVEGFDIAFSKIDIEGIGLDDRLPVDDFGGVFHQIAHIVGVDVFEHLGKLIVMQSGSQQKMLVEQPRGAQTAIESPVAALGVEPPVEVRLVVGVGAQGFLGQRRSGVGVDHPDVGFLFKIITIAPRAPLFGRRRRRNGGQ